jgi:ABC-type nitrate/sulfonate/bicarbonate transport system permease component
MSAHKSEAFLPAIGVVGLLAIWSLVTWRQWVDPVLLPSPLATFASLWHGMDGGPLGFDFVKTVYRTAASTLIAAVIAIPLGIVLGSSEPVRSNSSSISSARPRPRRCFRCFWCCSGSATKPRSRSPPLARRS